MIIAVDGTSASGKGTLAKGLAQHFNLAHLDTGTLYRGVAVRLIHHNAHATSPQQEETLAIAEAKQLQPSDLADPRLRFEATANLASKVAKIEGVRAALLDWQRDFALNPPKGKQGAVLDGRDIGTVVLPEADIKFFCTARLDIRAKRRYDELDARGESVDLAAVLRDLQARDTQDSNRQHAPLTKASDAIPLDTSAVGVDGMIKMALEAIQNR